MRQVLKRLTQFLLHNLGGAQVIFGLYRLFKGHPLAVVITYHRVVDGAKTRHFYTDYDRGHDVNLFRMQMAQLPRFFDCVSVEVFLAILVGSNRPRRHVALITFDDADSEFMSYAYPVLASLKIGATVMVPSGLVESDRQLWHVRVSNLVMSAQAEHWQTLRRRCSEWPEGVARELQCHELSGESQRRAACKSINRAFDLSSHNEVDATIAAWEEVIQPQRHLGIHCMTWDELRFLQEHDIGIESHTATHRKLTRLDDESLLSELVDSKHTIEQKLGRKVRAVAYPQGYFDERIGEAARQAGYEGGFTTIKAACRYPIDGRERYRIPRMDLVGDTPSEVTLHLAKICLRSFYQT